MYVLDILNWRIQKHAGFFINLTKSRSTFWEITKGGSDLVRYSIDRDIFKTESIFCRKNGINPVRSHIGLPRSLYSLLTADIKSDFLYIKWSIFILINVWF